ASRAIVVGHRPHPMRARLRVARPRSYDAQPEVADVVPCAFVRELEEQSRVAALRLEACERPLGDQLLETERFRERLADGLIRDLAKLELCLGRTPSLRRSDRRDDDRVV